MAREHSRTCGPTSDNTETTCILLACCLFLVVALIQRRAYSRTVYSEKLGPPYFGGYYATQFEIIVQCLRQTSPVSVVHWDVTDIFYEYASVRRALILGICEKKKRPSRSERYGTAQRTATNRTYALRSERYAEAPPAKFTATHGQHKWAATSRRSGRAHPKIN